MNPSQVNILLAKLGREQKAELRGMTKEDLLDGCHDLRIHIKNQLGFHRINRCWRIQERDSTQMRPLL